MERMGDLWSRRTRDGRENRGVMDTEGWEPLSVSDGMTALAGLELLIFPCSLC